MMDQIDSIFEHLCSSQKLERDKGIIEFDKYLSSLTESSSRDLEARIQHLLEDPASSWETKHGGLTASKIILQNLHLKCSDDFPHNAKTACLKLVEDPEFRVRLAAGELLGTLCKREGAAIYGSVQDVVLEGVRINLERPPIDEATDTPQDAENLTEKLSSSPRSRERLGSTSADQIFHDTAGWKNLETWMKCLQSMINGCGPAFNDYINQELLDLLFTALTHTNRFVRETGYYVCAALVGCVGASSDAGPVVEDNAIYRHGAAFAAQLSAGLADNWSQVRLAASTATRAFLLSLGDSHVREQFYPALLPPLCLNRYYVAEGVRIYNQTTWRQVTGGEGPVLVERYISDVVKFYVSQSEADNHAVREAACACIAELGCKVSMDVVRGYVPTLLDALLVCFRDESWPVRDAACVACGNFVKCFPEEARPVLGDLFPLFYDNLQDNISSVRIGASVAIAKVVRAYGTDTGVEVLQKVNDGLSKIETQPETADRYSGLDKAPATYGVVKRLRDNDEELHTDKTMYSCGSLAPKMNKGKRGGGCMDHQFRKPSEPWETADGCVLLVGELSSVPELSSRVCEVLPLVVTACTHHHYTQHVHFIETVCKQIPVIARGLSKRVFKPHLESFFEAIFYAASCDNALTVAAAGSCLSQLSSILGPNILRGRVENYNPRYLDILEQNMAPGMGPGMGPGMMPSALAGGMPPSSMPGSRPF